MSDLITLIFGGLPTALLFGFHKKLDDKRFFNVAFLLTITIATVALINHDLLVMKKGSGVAFLFMPFLFVVEYVALTKLYIYLFGWEPVMIYINGCTTAKRKCVFWDYIYSFLVLLLPYFSAFIIAEQSIKLITFAL
jgi:hypothetical protein